MNRNLVKVLGSCMVLVIALIGNTHSREKRNPAIRLYRPVSEGELPAFVDPALMGLMTSAAVDTYNIVRYDFEEWDWQGWTQVDNTEQAGTFIHVDDFAGLGGGDFGRLVPLEGTKSIWCGVRTDSEDPYLCGWVFPPGYGNNWNQVLQSDSISFTGYLDISFKAMFDSEADWDITRLQYFCGGWNDIATFDGTEQGTYSYRLINGQYATKIRFHFESDGAWSDQDGLYNTDGAFVIDSLVISDLHGVKDYEDFESANVGDQVTDGDGNGREWRAWAVPGYGTFSGLYSGMHQDNDPCNTNLSTQIVFFIGSDVQSTSYPGLYDTPFCRGAGGVEAPCQNEMVVSPIIDLTKYSTNRDEVQDADIPPGRLSDLGGLLLRYTMYRDLPLPNAVYWLWYVRNIDDTGCPGEWRHHGIIYYYWTNEDYIFSTLDIARYVEENSIQVALGVVDWCEFWYLRYADCAHHTPTPWYDNVRIQRYDASGPQWSSRDLDLFQDQFPTGGPSIESYVRIDAANDLNAGEDPLIRPGDSAAVTCRSPLGGGIMYDIDGWPQVYCHVRATYIGCASPCPGHVDPKPEHLYGPAVAGAYGRYVSDDGARWTTLQCAEARVGPPPGTPVPDKYMVDLNDSLFTRGYLIEYYFSANDSAGRTSYHPENAPARADYTYGSAGGIVYEGVSYLFEMTCLPLGCSDILYVDDFHGRGTLWGTVEQYFNDAFKNYLPSDNWPERYDVNNPSSLVGNGLARSATSMILTCYYRTIIWDSGNLSNGTIGDGSTDSDKTNDCQLLSDWMTLHPDSIAGVGLWVLGDDVAGDLNSLTSAQALQLLATWCGVRPYDDPNWRSYYALTGGYPGGVMNPLITGTTGGIFYNGIDTDSWYLLGGCPVINQFDCLTAYSGATIAAAYPDHGSYTEIGALIQNMKLNASNTPVRTVWSGHSFMYIRNDPEEPYQSPVRWRIFDRVMDYFSQGMGHYLEARIPGAYRLAQNFPNPFNPVTTIRFDIKERGHVSLKIYNVAGQLVRTLVDEVKDASSYSIHWDGTNNSGAEVASGVYFYKMQSKDFVRTRKLILLR